MREFQQIPYRVSHVCSLLRIALKAHTDILGERAGHLTLKLAINQYRIGTGMSEEHIQEMPAFRLCNHLTLKFDQLLELAINRSISLDILHDFGEDRQVFLHWCIDLPSLPLHPVVSIGDRRMWGLISFAILALTLVRDCFMVHVG